MSDISQPVVPPELCDVVIDYLHDHPTTLAVCALVCRAWVPSSRMHQFHTVVLHRIPVWRGQKLLLLSDPSSTVLPYVRHLALGEGRGRSEDPHWIDAALPAIRVHDLEALQSLELVEVKPGRLSLESRRQLHALCRRPQTVALRSHGFGSIGYLLDLFQACVSVEKFVAFGSYEDIAQLSARDATSFKIPPHLHSWEADTFMFDLMVALCRFEPRHSIRNVHIASIYPGRASDVARFVQWCGSTVDEVTLDFSDPRTRTQDDPPPEVDFCDAGGLKHNASLRIINLSGDPSQLVSVLKQVVSMSVEHVSINTTPSALGDFDYDGLTALFSRGLLASAKLRLLASDTEVQPLIEARDKAYAKLGSLRENGRLVFERAGGYPMDPSTPPLSEAKWATAFHSTSLVLDSYYVPVQS